MLDVIVALSLTIINNGYILLNMVISKSKNFLFYHMYKVAGSSIRRALIPYSSKRIVVAQNIVHGLSLMKIDMQVAPIYQFHPHLDEVKSYMGSDFDSYYKFGFCRNPFDLQCSLYSYMKKNRRHYQHDLIKYMTFEEYLRWRLNSEIKLASDFVCDADGRLLLDDIFHYEKLGEDFKSVCLKLNIQATLPHINSSSSKNGKEVVIDQILLDEFKSAYKKDYNIFGYEK